LQRGGFAVKKYADVKAVKEMYDKGRALAFHVCKYLNK
jgi:hypothetical protein